MVKIVSGKRTHGGRLRKRWLHGVKQDIRAVDKSTGQEDSLDWVSILVEAAKSLEGVWIYLEINMNEIIING